MSCFQSHHTSSHPTHLEMLFKHSTALLAVAGLHLTSTSVHLAHAQDTTTATEDPWLASGCSMAQGTALMRCLGDYASVPLFDFPRNVTLVATETSTNPLPLQLYASSCSQWSSRSRTGSLLLRHIVCIISSTLVPVTFQAYLILTYAISAKNSQTAGRRVYTAKNGTPCNWQQKSSAP